MVIRVIISSANANEWLVSANKLTIDIPEERVVKIALTNRQENDLLRRYSDYTRLLLT